MIAFLIDADNFKSPRGVDEAFQAIERSEGAISIRRAYGSAESLRSLAETLRKWAVHPYVNMNLGKNTTDLSLAVDAMAIALTTLNLRVLVIGSGDADFVPLVVRLRERGIKVVCVAERGKMAQDAAPAYDQVLYVGEDKDDRPTTLDTKPALTPRVRATAKGVAAKSQAAKVTPPKPSVPKQSGEIAAAAKKSVSAAKEALTVEVILAAVPNLQTGQWQPLGEVVKVLHAAKLLSKSATSTKLFKRFPEAFELAPTDKPNQVRFCQ
jgi:uncharacterized LabA/DUF88 family protein